MENLIDMEKKKRGIKPPFKDRMKSNASRVGKGFGRFLGGAAKGALGLAKEGATYVGKEIRAEIDADIKSRQKYRETRRKIKIRQAEISAMRRYGVKPKKMKKRKFPGRKEFVIYSR